MKKKSTDEQAFEHLLSPEGYGFTKTQLAEMVGISKQALTRWDKVPLKYVRVIHEKTGIPKRFLLPSEFS